MNARIDSLALDEIDIHSTDRLERDGFPWEAWDLLRRDAPVHWYERDDIEPFWAVTRYEDVRFVGANDRLFCNGGGRLRLASREDDEGMWQRYRTRIERFGWDPDEVPDLVYMDRPRHTKGCGWVSPSRICPTEVRCDSRPWRCWVSTWMSWKQRWSG